MSTWAESIYGAVERLSCRDLTLEYINLNDKHHTDAELAELVDCLLAHPDVVTTVWLGGNQLTDETGAKLARYLATSSLVQTLGLSDNQLGMATYLAMAAALRVNSSLQYLSLSSNKAEERARIEAAFIEALRLNPDRPAESDWQLFFEDCGVDFERLKDAADQLGHPSLQVLLALRC